MIPHGLPNQFLNWRTVSGRKMPCDPTGEPVNAHDPTVWLSHEQALQSPYGTAFAITAADPWFFLDLDKCAPNGQWSAEASAIFQSFTGAWGEVSQSGTGLHIMGYCDKSKLADRRNKWDGWLEFYVKERFIAFGDQGWSVIGGGEPTNMDWTNQLLNVVPQREFLGDLPDGIDERYTGPDDDDKLIEMLLKSTSTASVFGKGITAADLWNANAPVLAERFPDYDGVTGAFDHSSADMALMSHLAFWTGKDQPRMDRLFRRSGLMRPKYEGRKDYRNDTIQKAARLAKRVYDFPKKEDRPASIDNPVNKEVFLSIAEMIEYFKGCVYVRDAHRILVPDGTMLKSEQFNAVYGGHWFQMLPDQTKPSKKAFEAFTENACHQFPQAITTCFRPDLAPGTILDDGTVNSYVDPQTVSTEGDPSPVWDLMCRQLPNEEDRLILINYLAAVVQYPGINFQWCPVMQGCEGNGKTLWARCVQQAVGIQYCHTPRANQLSEKYNDYIVDKIFITVEEVWMKGRLDVLNDLKEVLTNDRVEVRSMARDKRMVFNCTNWYMCTNYLDGVIKKKGDRRYAIFYTAQQDVDDLRRDGMDGDYFPNLYHWLKSGGYAVITNWLKNFPIDPKYNPAGSCHRAPITSSTGTAIRMSAGPIEQEILEACDSGLIGFRNDWISSYALGELLKNERKQISRQRLAQILNEMGYRNVMRAPRPIIQQDNLRPTLWYRGDKPEPTFEDFMAANGWKT